MLGRTARVFQGAELKSWTSTIKRTPNILEKHLPRVPCGLKRQRVSCLNSVSLHVQKQRFSSIVPDKGAAGAESLHNGNGVPGAQFGGDKFVIVFTCSVCETRSAKSISKVAWEEGVVLCRCPGCENLHLMADRLGWFEDESWDVEKLMKERGHEVKCLTDDNLLELTLKDVVGARKSNVKEKE